MTLDIRINHEDHDEMRITMTPPGDKAITVFNRDTGHDDGLQTFSYTSATNADLAKLVGSNIAGVWTLNVMDVVSGSDTGTLQRWALTFDATPVTTPSNENLLEQFFNAIFGDTTCNSTGDDCVPKVGGSAIHNTVGDNSKAKGSIGLGGIKTTDGREGFIISGHGVGHGDVGKIIAHDLKISNGTATYMDPLGEVVINNGPARANLLAADMAFVEYPTECKVTETQLCYGNTDVYKPTVRPLEIFKSNGNTYTVIGEDRFPARNDNIRAMGHTSQLLTGTVYDNYHRITDSEGHSIAVAMATFQSRSGDSGGPVFTPPNTDDEVNIAGAIKGAVSFGSSTEYTAYMPWYQIVADLKLKAITADP